MTSSYWNMGGAIRLRTPLSTPATRKLAAILYSYLSFERFFVGPVTHALSKQCNLVALFDITLCNRFRRHYPVIKAGVFEITLRIAAAVLIKSQTRNTLFR